MATEAALAHTPVLAGDPSAGAITDRIAGIVLDRPTHWGWIVGATIAGTLSVVFLITITVLVIRGVGIFGIDEPVAWGFAITNFVWWVGIGHAGTFISAFLLLLRQRWRTSINRFAEAMTIFAVTMAGLMPIVHLGRPWFFYWLMPYPNIMNLWPQWRSPLVWDIFAIGTYVIVSILFWYMGMLPDLATLRDRARRPAARVAYGLFALGWRGDARHWARYDTSVPADGRPCHAARDLRAQRRRRWTSPSATRPDSIRRSSRRTSSRARSFPALPWR